MNTWLDHSDNEQEKFYLSHADKVIVNRNLIYSLIIDLITYNFKSVSGLKILDLGCGDGGLSKELARIYPDNQYHLYDGSAEMLAEAKKSSKGSEFFFYHEEFSNIETIFKNRDFDIVVSSNAIHHLTYDDKSKLFSTIFDKINLGGVFLVSDFVLPESRESEHLQFRMWVDWINRNLKKKGIDEECNSYDDIPDRYKGKDENKPSSLNRQLNLMREIGFRGVDCFYKYGVNALFGGSK